MAVTFVMSQRSGFVERLCAVHRGDTIFASFTTVSRLALGSSMNHRCFVNASLILILLLLLRISRHGL